MSTAIATTVSRVGALDGSDWDAVVIGAGPAGSVAARELARAGASVLLVERRAFPRPKACGGCLNLRSLDVLARVGLGSLLQDLGAPSLERVELLAGTGRAVVPLPGGHSVSRESLDGGLAEAAIEEGVSFVCPAAARVAGLTINRRNITLSGEGESVARVTAKVVLAADGLGQSSLTDLPELIARPAGNSYTGLAAVISEAPRDLPPGTIRMVVGRGGYVGQVAVEQGRLDVAAAVDSRLLRESRSPHEIVAGLLRSAGVDGPLLCDAHWTGTLPLTRRSLRPAAERLFLLGDSAGYVEPFTGEGIASALTSAVEVLRPALRVLESPGAVEAERRGWIRRCEARWREQWLCCGLAAILRRPWLVRSLLRLGPLLGRGASPLIQFLNRPSPPETTGVRPGGVESEFRR